MPYSEENRPSLLTVESESYSERCETITPGAADQTDPSGHYYKYIVAATDGEVTFVPYRNADNATLTMTVQAGYLMPGRIRRVTASTATMHGWYD